MAKTPISDRKTIQRLLRATVSALDKQGLTYILDYGGALGLARTGELIPWDCDLDLSLPIDRPDWQQRIRWVMRYLRRRGLIVRTQWNKGRIIVFEGRIGIDLFFWQWTRQGEWERVQTLAVDERFGKGTRLEKRWVEETRVVRFETAQVRVPVDLEGLVAHRYGADWRTPQRYFEEQAEVFEREAGEAEAPAPEIEPPAAEIEVSGDPSETAAAPETAPEDVAEESEPDNLDTEPDNLDASPPAEPDKPERIGIASDAPLYTDLGEINVKEARDRCKEHRIKYGRLNKEQMIAELAKLRVSDA